MVAGGIGQTPFLLLAQEALGLRSFGNRPNGYAQYVHFCYGVRGKQYLAGVHDFESIGVNVSITTDDGSLGPARRVTDALVDILNQSAGLQTRIVCCGPEPMMEAVAHIANERQLPCEVSLETPMACGIGICFTCVAKVWQRIRLGLQTNMRRRACLRRIENHLVTRVCVWMQTCVNAELEWMGL